MKEAIASDPTLTTRDVASKLSCSQSSIVRHFSELRLVSRLGEWVPHHLSPAQLRKRVEACQQLLAMHRTFNWLDSLITGDEKWVLYANITRRRQWLFPGQAATVTPKAGLHPKKRMLCVWWNVTGVVYWELLPEKCTINATKYRAQLSSMAAKLAEKGLGQDKVFSSTTTLDHMWPRSSNKNWRATTGNCCLTHHILRTLHLLTIIYFGHSAKG